MTVPVSVAVEHDVGNATWTDLTFNGLIIHQSELGVMLGEVIQVYGTHYTITGLGNATCTVHFLTAPGVGVVATAFRTQAISQLTQYLANEAYNALKIMADLDKQTRVDQMLAEQIRRAPKFPQESTQIDVPIDEPESNHFLGWNNAAPWEIENKEIVPAGSVVPSNNPPSRVWSTPIPGVSTELSRSDHKHQNQREWHNIDDYGADPTGATASDVAIQALIDALDPGEIIYIPANTYRLDARLTTTKPIRIVGETARVIGFGAFTSSQSYAGSWLYFNHFDIGIAAEDTENVTLEHFGTKRTQPTPGPSWVPTNHDFDIVFKNSVDCVADDLMFLNATEGIYLDPGINVCGRITIRNCRGQFFRTGIEIGGVADVVTIENFAIEPFWVHDFTGVISSNENQVLKYQVLNCRGLAIYRSDLTIISNYFAIFIQSCVWIGQNALGTSRKTIFSNVNSDLSSYVVYIDPAVDSAWLQFDTLWGQGGVTALGVSALSVGLYVRGDNCLIDIGTFDYANPEAWGVAMEGTGNIVRIGRSTIFAYDGALAGHAAFNVDANNNLFLGPTQASSVGAAPKYAGAGRISVDEWRSFTPVVTSSAGTITTYSTNSKYKISGNNTVEIQYDIAVTDNGTGSGLLYITIPFGDPIQMFAGSGKNLSTGVQNVSWVDSDTNRIVVTKYDGTYPVASGQRIAGGTQYVIAPV